MLYYDVCNRCLAVTVGKEVYPMVCPECGHKIEEGSMVCRFCGFEVSPYDVFHWSELPPMPTFNKPGSDDSLDDSEGERRFLSKHMKRNLLHVFTVFTEICILTGVISSIYIWKTKNTPNTVTDAQNIVYSSEDIVMMLVRNKNEWLFQKPENGYNACCFIDMDFDGSPELVSISYDNENSVTQMAAYRVRSCVLENISVDYDNDCGFFDIGQSLSLCYAPDTKEMLYFTTDYQQNLSGRITSLGCFYLHENQIFKEYFFSEIRTYNEYKYTYYDDEQSIHNITKQDFIKQQKELSARLIDLKLNYEWVVGNDLEDISSQKLAALLLRSYDSFGYDSSGLALQ